MKLNLEKINGFDILTVQEPRIDAHNSAELKEYITQMIESGEKQLIVRLDQVRFIDSSGLGALLSGHKQLITKAGKFALSNIQPQVLSMFELTRLNRVFEIYLDVDEAVT
ncbi:MAG: STAS domain-containing protein [Gammaproteobacteria bacterium]